ncbi:hypothetical protein GX51_06518 [Blastomyces parvus]|uniref:Uncharacterized protein n=1 Tax=Blastomyces parvus TaxID=2060905 RepID=A0A2B7WQA0_9EURO|nr:hypothetical protein GX51_06518 [Blastomyces parvus]
MAEELSTREPRDQRKLRFRNSRVRYRDDDSDMNRTSVAPVQQEEEVLYEIDPRALEKLPERLQNNYRQLFQERVARLTLKNPNFKYRPYNYMDHWQQGDLEPAEKKQPRNMKRQCPRKHDLLQESGIINVPRLQFTEQRGQMRVMNSDQSPFEILSRQDSEVCKDGAELGGQKK